MKNLRERLEAMDWSFYLKLLTGPLLGALVPIPGFGGLLFALAVSALITTALIRSEVKEKVPNAFKAQITSKSTRKVTVGIFDDDDRKLKDIEMVSQQGISDDVYEGQTIYC